MTAEDSKETHPECKALYRLIDLISPTSKNENLRKELSSVLSAQFLCTFKIALKIKSINKNLN